MTQRLRAFCGILLLGSAFLIAYLAGPLSYTAAFQPQDSIFSTRTRTLFNVERPGLALRGIVMPDRQFTRELAETAARDFLKSTEAIKYAELIMGPNEEDLHKSIDGTFAKLETETSFDKTLGQLGDKLRLPVTPAARLVRIRDSALFSYREPGVSTENRAGVTESLLVGARDPTRFEVEGVSYRLLHLAVKRSTKDEFSGAVFFRSSAAPSCEACAKLASEFEDLTGGGDWEVQIRKDVWFASASFPLIFRFARDNEPVVYVNAHGQIIPPTISEYYRGSHVICHRYYSRFSCDGYGRYESIPWTR